MKRKEFVNTQSVKEFVEWLTKNLPKLPVCLRIPNSRFVPGGVTADVQGIGKVLDHYMWKSAKTWSGDWTDTNKRLKKLSKDLRSAVRKRDDSDTFDVCCKILVWGGDRNKSVGAYPFLKDKAKKGALCKYIKDTGKRFSLAKADDARLSPPITRMNAMLTKVHALYAKDGLPIYDSRVAAAIASLVELWRECKGTTDKVLPVALAFPATMKTRTVFKRFPNAKHHPSLMASGANAVTDTAKRWSSAKVRLGWIMKEVLKKLPDLFSSCCPSPRLADRMHAFEASLFMTGYDVTCLDCGTNTGVDEKSQAKLFRLLGCKATSGLAEPKNRKSIPTQSGNGTEIIYSGSLGDGFNVQWGALCFSIETECLQEIENNFQEQCRVPLGASVTGDVPPDSFGAWLLQQGWPSRRYASAIAAILCQEKMASKVEGHGRGIHLNFC